MGGRGRVPWSGTAGARVLALVMVVGLLTASAGAGPRVKISFWTWGNLAIAAKGVLKQAFEARNPNIEVEVVEYGIWDVHDKLSVALAAGTGAPDVSQLTMRRFGDFKTTGKLVDLTDYLSKYEGQFGEIAWNGGKHNGRILGLGFTGAPGILFYRKDIYDQVGVNGQDLKTWEDFVRIGKTVTDEKADRHMTFISTPTGAYSADVWMLYLMSRGGQIFDRGGNVVRDNKAAEAAFQFVYDLVYVHKIARMESFIRPAFYTAVKSGKIATLAGAVPWLGVLKTQAPELSGKWRAAPWPAWPGSSRRISGDFGASILTIPKGTKNFDAALQWVEFVGATRAAQEALLRNGQWPNYKPVLESPVMQEGDPYLGGQSLADVVKQQTSGSFNWFYWTEATEIIGAEIDSMMARQKTPQQAWRDAEKLLAERLKR